MGEELQEPHTELVDQMEGLGEFVGQDVRLEGVECQEQVGKQESG